MPSPSGPCGGSTRTAVVDGEVAVSYRAEHRVPPGSYTETYAALKLLVDNWRWKGVPFYLRTGKRMASRLTEIAIQFKRPPVTIFQDAGAAEGLEPNVLVLRVQPDEGFSLHIESKLPGHGMELQPVAMDYSYGGTLYELPFRAYETVLIDVMEGDMTLFTRADQAEEAWRVVGPVLDAWSRGAARRRFQCTRQGVGGRMPRMRFWPPTVASGGAPTRRAASPRRMRAPLRLRSAR